MFCLNTRNSIYGHLRTASPSENDTAPKAGPGLLILRSQNRVHDDKFLTPKGQKNGKLQKMSGVTYPLPKQNKTAEAKKKKHSEQF